LSQAHRAIADDLRFDDSVPLINHDNVIIQKGIIFVKVVYDTSPITTIRAVHGGWLMEGLRHYTLEQDEHEGLHGSGCRSIIPYVHGERVVLSCVCVRY
jgi:hypothetical protein